MGHVDSILLRLPPVPDQGGTYVAYLESLDLLGHGFAYRELVRLSSPRHVLPPRRLWPRMAATLALANEMRARMVAAGARGLTVAAAYRPLGGENDSQHKHNAALDLDLLSADQGGSMGSELARTAAELWREHEDLEAGVGTYARDGRLWTNRVHIDTGYRFRCWQGTGRDASGRYTWAKRPAALILAPPDGSHLDDLSAVADGLPRVAPTRVLEVIGGTERT